MSGQCFLTTRFLPKRHVEVTGQGSLYWIVKHQLVARSPILRFGEAEGGSPADPTTRPGDQRDLAIEVVASHSVVPCFA